MWRRTMEQNSLSLEDYARSLRREEEPGSRFDYRSIDNRAPDGS